MKNINQIKDLIKNIEDYPKKGIIFRDITPLLNNERGLYLINEELDSVFFDENGQYKVNFNKIVAIESRGFIFGSLLASISLMPLVLARKPGKLPGVVLQKKYQLEYGEDSLCIQLSDIKKGDRVVIVDDLLATGGTAKTTCSIVEQLGGEVSACYFLIELEELEGRYLLENAGIKVLSSIRY
jgi:adenine phosphoribosyltransferase